MAGSLRVCGDGACFMDCVLSGDFWPMVLVALAVFYCTVAILKFLPLSPKDPEFANIFHVAHHAPSLVLTIPISWYSLRSIFTDLWNLEPEKQYGSIAGVSSHNDIVEANGWFVAFLIIDTVLMIVHGLGKADGYIHHAVFSVFLFSQLGGGHCCSPYLVAGLLAQEASSPLLNVFLLLRGFIGLEKILTQVVFVLFAAVFMSTRVVGLSWIVVRWLLNYQPCYQPYERIIMTSTVLLSLVLQYHWAQIIVKNLLKGLGITGASNKKNEVSADDRRLLPLLS